eukprot:5743825-Prymnesium_polylepis.1
MEDSCRSIIEGLLAQEPAKRLGNVDNGNDIKTHPFFAAPLKSDPKSEPVAWEGLLTKATKPPFKSKSADSSDTQNFHKAFTMQAAPSPRALPPPHPCCTAPTASADSPPACRPRAALAPLPRAAPVPPPRHPRVIPHAEAFWAVPR